MKCKIDDRYLDREGIKCRDRQTDRQKNKRHTDWQTGRERGLAGKGEIDRKVIGEGDRQPD